MTLRLSSGVRNHLLNGGSMKQAFSGGRLKIYSGAQPSSADAAPTGTLLATVTDASGSNTAEVRAAGTVTLSGSSGSITACTVNGLTVLGETVPFATDLTTTAANLAEAINEYPSVPKIEASSSGAIVTLKAPRGVGATANGWVVDSTTSTLVGTDVNMSGGVTAVNGLKFDKGSAGIMDKLDSQTWSGVAASTGTAGWFRFEGPEADSGALDSTESQIRMDGAVSTSGAQLNMSSTSITASATQTITSFPITLPTS